jgi:hypothetical protein
MLLKLFNKMGEMLSYSLYEASIALILNLDKDTTKKENNTVIKLMSSLTNILNKILAN